MGHEVPHQYLALSRDIPQLRCKGNRIPGGLHPFVGHSFLQVCGDLALLKWPDKDAMWAAGARSCVTKGEAAPWATTGRRGMWPAPYQPSVGRSCNGTRWVYWRAMEVPRADQANSAVASVLPVYNFARAGRGRSYPRNAPRGPDPRIATRQASSSPRLLKERAWGPEWAEGKIDGGLDKWRRPIK
jgi:hypothetical protein